MRDLSVSDYAVAALSGVTGATVLVQPVPAGAVAVLAIAAAAAARLATTRHRQKTGRRA